MASDRWIKIYIVIGVVAYASGCAVSTLNMKSNCQNFGVANYCEIASGFGNAVGSLATIAYQQQFIPLNNNLVVGTSGTISL